MKAFQNAELGPPAEGQLEAFRHSLELEEKSRATIQKYLRDVRAFLKRRSGRGDALSKEEVIAYKAWLTGHYTPRSANSMLAALNRYLRFVGREDCCVRLLRVQQRTFCDQHQALTREDYLRLLDAAHRMGELRLYFVIETLCATGIRVSELPYITVEALRQGTAVARNKGKSRVILLPGDLCQELLTYAVQAGIDRGPVFITRTGRPLDRSNIWAGIKRLCRSAGVEADKGYPHNLRHLFARTFYSREKDLTHLADILGHRSVNTTRIYVVTSPEEHRAQLEALDLVIKN